LIQVDVKNTFEKLNYFNGLTAKQKNQAVTANKDGIVSLLQTTDNFQRLHSFTDLSLKQKKDAVASKKQGVIKTIANKDFINKLSNILGRYSEDDEEQSDDRPRKKPVYEFLDKENEEDPDPNMYPEKVKASSFAKKYQNSIPGYTLQLLTDSVIMDKSNIVKPKQTKFASINEPTIDKAIEDMKGHDATQIGRHLFEFYNLSPSIIAKGLKKAKFNSGEITKSLVSVFDATGEEIAADLKFAGFSPKGIITVLKNLYEQRTDVKGQEMVAEIVTHLHTAGFEANETSEAIKEFFKLSSGTASLYLQKAGYPPEDVVMVMKNIFHIPSDKIAFILAETYKLEKSNAKILLETAGFPLLIIQSALDKVYKNRSMNYR
jgi:hypothetical protein